MKYHIFLVFAITGLSLHAQKGVYVDAGFVDAFNNRTIYIDNEAVTGYQSYGYRAGLFYNYPINKLDLRLGAGIKQLFFSGRYQSSDFSGNASKLTANLAGIYNINTLWKVGMALEMENNRDFNDFRAQTSDLFRYNARILVNYKISENIFLSLDYSKALSPYSDYYLFTNPTDQVAIGVNYKLPWL